MFGIFFLKAKVMSVDSRSKIQGPFDIARRQAVLSDSHLGDTALEQPLKLLW